MSAAADVVQRDALLGEVTDAGRVAAVFAADANLDLGLLRLGLVFLPLLVDLANRVPCRSRAVLDEHADAALVDALKRIVR